MPYIRCKVEQNRYISLDITDIPGQCEMKNIRYWGNQAYSSGLKRGRNGAKMLIIDNFTTVMPYIRCKLNKIVTDIPGQCEMKNIRYLGNQAFPGG